MSAYYPAGCTERDIERRFGGENHTCEDCGELVDEGETQCQKCKTADEEKEEDWRSPSMPPLDSQPGATWGCYKLDTDGWLKLNPDWKKP